MKDSISSKKEPRPMGADIHIYAEAFYRNQWQVIGAFFKSSYYRPKDLPEPNNTPLTIHPYEGRNYKLFGLLAGVRNNSIKPINEPRGLPSHISEEVLKEYGGWGSDAHNASWFTLEELIEAHQQPIIEKEIYSMDAQYYKDYLITGEHGFFHNKSDNDVAPISETEMKKRILLDIVTGKEFTQVESTYNVSDYLLEIIDNLSLLRRYVNNDPTKIRTVFWFDN